MNLLKKFITSSLLVISINNLSANEVPDIDYAYLSKKDVTKTFFWHMDAEKELIRTKNPQNLAIYIRSWQVAMGKALHLLIKRLFALNNDYQGHFLQHESLNDPKLPNYALQFKDQKIPLCQVEDKINGGFFPIPASTDDDLMEFKRGNIPLINVITNSGDDIFNTMINNIIRDLLIRYFFVKENYCALAHLVLQPQNFNPGGLWDFYNNRISNNSNLLDLNGLFKAYITNFKQAGMPQYTPYPFSRTINLDVFHRHIAQINRADTEQIVSLCACIHKAAVMQGHQNPVLRPNNIELNGNNSEFVIKIDIRKFFEKKMVDGDFKDNRAQDIKDVTNTLAAHKINYTPNVADFINNLQTVRFATNVYNTSKAAWLVYYDLLKEFPIDASLQAQINQAKAAEEQKKKKKSMLPSFMRAGW